MSASNGNRTVNGTMPANGSQNGSGSRRRQWGSDPHVNPMPAVPRTTGELTLAIGRAAVIVTAGAWLALVVMVVARQLLGHGPGRAGVAQTIAFLVVVTLLATSALAYLVARLGFYYRARHHRRVPRAQLDEFFAARRPSLTTLVPSYQEEAGVIKMTLLSAALQEYPDINVVLLIDNPPNPRYAEPYRLLLQARETPGEVQKLLSGPRARFDTALALWEPVLNTDRGAYPAELATLADHYEWAAAWVNELGSGYEATDHNERFFATHVLGQLACDLGVTAAALRSAWADDPARVPARRVAHLYRRLAWTFRAELTSFERKDYASLSSEPNKAMNLNSYIGLMGGSYCDVTNPGGRFLVPADGRAADLVVPDSDYVMTLDADSVIMPEYCLRLVHLLEQRGNEGIAVAQAPYSAYPGSASRLERIAGATTDLQHIIHQGMEFHGASFWVGANAVIRKQALDDVGTTEYVGGSPIRIYIQDRTLIEDTESTINLAARGWKVYNYPERLSYSETPPDFGALCIQRHRWANGGLLILPKLWSCMRQRRKRGERTTAGELLLRLNYMASIFWSSVSVLFLLTFPFNEHMLTPLTFLVAAPYFLAMALDLSYCGYKPLDVLRVYGFNLLLLPINLAGSLSSIAQGLTGAKGRFQRTPKVSNRTIPPLLYVVLPYVLLAVCVYTFKRAYDHKLWGDAAFAAVNALLATYAIVAFIGIWNSIVDLAANFASFLHKSQGSKSAPSRRPAPVEVSQTADVHDWERVLYHGVADPRPEPPPRKPHAEPAHPRAERAGAATDPRPAAELVA